MAFMRKDVNLGLLLLIIVSILLFAGFSVYYQTSFKDVSLEYQTKLEQLQDVTGQLADKRLELNETYALKIKAETDRKALDSRYKDASDENTRLSSDVTSLQLEVANTKNELASKTSELGATKSLLAKTQSELSSAKSKKASLESDLDEVCDAYTALNGGVEHEEC
jgi:chromosome segregation ATPase|tara:strand:- start:40 stop:537 length:498 start_codon:yes stop_codon:yes gene_type:complete